MSNTTAQNLKNFYSAIRSRGFSRDFQARIDEITFGKNSFKFGADAASQSGLLYIKSFSLPGIKKSVATVKYKGVDIHAPGNRNYGSSNSWEVTLYVDKFLTFRNWLQNRLIETAANTTNSTNHIPTVNDYALVSVYDDNLQVTNTYKIEGLYVVELPNQSYDVSGTGKIQEVKVVFGYQTWKVVYPIIPDIKLLPVQIAPASNPSQTPILTPSISSPILSLPGNTSVTTAIV